MNFGEPFSRVKFSGFMKNENAFAPAKNTMVSPRIRVFHTGPCWRVRSSVNANGSLRNFSASPTKGAPNVPGGGRRSLPGCSRPGAVSLMAATVRPNVITRIDARRETWTQQRAAWRDGPRRR